MSNKLSEIQTKIMTASPEQLNAILEILNKPVAPVVPKKRATNAWVEYLSAYKIKNPDETHKIAMANALKLYKAQPVVEVVEKIKKEKKIIKCAICDYMPANGCKSNLNRHIKTKHGRKQQMMADGKIKGLNRTHKVRAETSKNVDVRAESAEKLKEAEALQAKLNKAIALLTQNIVAPTQAVVPTSSSHKKRYPKSLK